MNDYHKTKSLKNMQRRYIRNIISALPLSKRKEYDHQLYNNFTSLFTTTILPLFNRVNLTVLTYMPLPDEPDIRGILSDFDTITRALPVSNDDGNLSIHKDNNILKSGLFGIAEPSQDNTEIAYDDIDVAVIPARAFGTDGSRLGRGKGYYDRFLSCSKLISIGLCYDEQILQNIPMAPHDVRVNCIITPTQIYQC